MAAHSIISPGLLYQASGLLRQEFRVECPIPLRYSTCQSSVFFPKRNGPQCISSSNAARQLQRAGYWGIVSSCALLSFWGIKTKRFGIKPSKWQELGSGSSEYTDTCLIPAGAKIWGKLCLKVLKLLGEASPGSFS